MELLTIIFRTVFFYIFIIIVFRLMGKREIGQLSVPDLVISILMAELVAISIENKNDSLVFTIIPLICLLLLEISFAFISLKSSKFRNLIDGKPSLIIDKGMIRFKEMIKQRYTLDDLLLELRSKGVRTINDVEYAILENNGTLSVFKYNFLKLKTSNPLPLVLDGVIETSTLNYLKKDKKWLLDILKEKKVSLKNIFYAFYKNEDIFIIKKDETI